MNHRVHRGAEERKKESEVLMIHLLSFRLKITYLLFTSVFWSGSFFERVRRSSFHAIS